jgi:hypothetical protein
MNKAFLFIASCLSVSAILLASTFVMALHDRNQRMRAQAAHDVAEIQRMETEMASDKACDEAFSDRMKAAQKSN